MALTGAIFGNGASFKWNSITSGNPQIRFYDTDESHYCGFHAAGTTTANLDYTLPAAGPASNGYVLSSTTAGVMSWVANGAGPAGANLSVGSGISITAGSGTAALLVAATLAVNQAFSPTWTSIHTFAAGIYVSGPFTSTKQFAQFGDDHPFYIVGATSGSGSPALGFNATYTSGWIFGNDSSAEYGAVVGYAQATGLLTFYSSDAVGAAAGAMTLAVTASLSRLGVLTVGAASAVTGQVAFAHASTANVTKIQSGNAGAAVTYTLPTAAPGSNGYVLASTTGGAMSWVANGGTSSSVLFSKAVETTIADTGDATTFLDAGVGTKTITASTLKVGSQIRFRCGGYYRTKVLTPGNFQIRFTLGTSFDELITLQGFPANISATPGVWWSEYHWSVLSIGGSGTVTGQGSFTYTNPTVTDGIYGSGIKRSSTAIDTTANCVLDVTGTWATADELNSITCEWATIEVFYN